MALTLQQKQEMLRSKGFDPNRFYFEEDTGDIFEGQDPNVIEFSSENIIPPRVDISPKSSATTVFAKSAVSSVIPTTGGLSGGALGSRIPGPWPVKLAGGLAGALIGGKTLGDLQSKIVPESFYPTALEQEEHPIASILGSLAPTAVALNPVESIRSLGRAGSTIGKRLFSPAGRASTTAAEMTGLRNFGINTGVNVGTQAGLNLVEQARDDKPFDVGSLVRDSALGLLLNEPTKLGSKLFGFKPSYRGVKTEAEILASRPGLKEQTRARASEAEVVQPPAIDIPGTLGAPYSRTAYPRDPLTLEQEILTKRKIDDLNRKGLPGLHLRDEPARMREAEQRMEEEGGIVRESALEGDVSDIYSRLKAQDKALTDEKLARIYAKEGHNEVVDFYSQPKPKGKPVEIQQRTDTSAPYKYSSEEAPYTVKPGDEDRVLDTLLRKRGLKLGQYGKTIVDEKGNPVVGTKGNPVKGRAVGRTIDLATSPAHPETAHHEAGHVQLMDLATSNDAKDRVLVSKVFAELGKPEITAEEFIRLNTAEAKARAEGRTDEVKAIQEKYLAAEEELMQFAGLEGAKRELGKGKFKQWFKDYLSRFNLGEKPARQQFSARQKYEAPYGTRGTEGDSPITSVAKNFDPKSPETQAKIKASLDKRPEVKVTDPNTGKEYAFSFDGEHDLSIIGKSPNEMQLTAKEENPWVPKFGTHYESTLAEKGAVIKERKNYGNIQTRQGDTESQRPQQTTSGEAKGEQERINESRPGTEGESSPKNTEKLSEEESVYAKIPKQGLTKDLSEARFPDDDQPVAAVILAKNGKYYKGITHEHAFRNGIELGAFPKELEDGMDGFLTKDNKFLSRDATYIATGERLAEELKLGKQKGGEKLSEEESKFEREPTKDELKEARISKVSGQDKRDIPYGLDRATTAKSLETGKGIQEDLGEASFKAAKEAEKAEKIMFDAGKTKGVEEDISPFVEASKNFSESFNKANFKAQEAEAFERPDVERHSEDESAYIKDTNILPKKPIFSIFTSVTDKVAEGKRDSYTHNKVSTRLRNYFNTSDIKQGEYGQDIVKEYENYTPEQVANVYRNRWAKNSGEPISHTLNAEESKLNNAIEEMSARPEKDAKALGLNIKPGLHNAFDPDIMATILERPNSIDAKRAKRQWKDWMVKKGTTAKDAEGLVENYFKAQQEYGDNGGLEFKEVRRAEEYGLPWELVDKNPVRAALRNGRKLANNVSYFEHIQSDEEMRHALGVKDQFGNSQPKVGKAEFIGTEKNVQDAMSFVYGRNEVTNPRFAALMRLAGNLVMGHGTAIRNLASLPTQLAPYDVRIRDVLKGLANMGDTRRRAYESGAARVNPAEFDYLGESGSPDRVVKVLDKMSNFLRKYQGRNLSDKMEGEFLYSVGEEWAKNMLATKNMDMLERASGKAGYEIPSKITPKDIQELAAGFVRLTRGSYGPQGLPSWALKGNVAPFVALNRFGIEKWNNVAKDVIQPLKNGNIMPFLKYTLSGVMTGAMIEEINELLSNKKGSDPTVAETLAAYAEKEDAEVFAHKIIGLMQLSSYAGIMGDFAKMASRFAEGKEVTYSSPVGMPLYTLATETFAENLGAAVGALRNGEDPTLVFAELIKTIPLQTIQAGRYAKGHLDKDETARKESFRDVRVYKETTGKASREELKVSKGNPFEGLKSKEFKRTGDIGEAAEMLPSLVQEAFKKAGNDPYRLKSEFRKLKSNNFQIMPSPENEPLEFWRYLTYLRNSQGEEKASERVAKFLSQRETNRAKSSMVP